MNVAYIDNQNLYMATKHAAEPWMVDMRRFRIYLREKYRVEVANLFMGSYEPEYQGRYNMFHDMGYSIVFREHAHTQLGKKKGNVDADIVFEMMLDAYASKLVDSAVLVSGDGDYKKVVSHLITIGKFERLLLPSHANASSLYKKLPEAYKAYLDAPDVMRKISRRK